MRDHDCAFIAPLRSTPLLTGHAFPFFADQADHLRDRLLTA
jgi:hypothetical protein